MFPPLVDGVTDGGSGRQTVLPKAKDEQLVRQDGFKYLKGQSTIKLYLIREVSNAVSNEIVCSHYYLEETQELLACKRIGCTYSNTEALTCWARAI